MNEHTKTKWLVANPRKHKQVNKGGKNVGI